MLLVIAFIFHYQAYDLSNAKMQNDVVFPRCYLGDVIFDILHHVGERIQRLWPLSKLREKALKKIMTHIQYEDENSRYINAGCVQKVSK